MNGFVLIVIGGGPGGYVAALEAAKLGKTVAVVERDAVGGTCLNRGCIPTKALLRASRVFREATCSEELGIHVQNASCDRAAMYAHVQKVTAQLRSGIELLFQKGNITLLHGSAQIEAPGRVLVDGTPYEAQNLLIATGSLPAMPPIPGIHLPGVVTSDQLLQGDGVDCKRLAIIGGGVIGVEFAQIYSDLGCAVTILEALPRLLPTMDREISQNLSMILKKRGVSVYTGASVQEIASGDGELLCRFSQKGSDLETAADCLLVCTGRRPNTEGLFAASFDFPMERGYIPVDEQYRTQIPGVYAVGDVISGGIQLAHAAEAEAKNAVHAMFGGAPVKNVSAIPACIFTEPEIASVGLTADAAKAEGRKVTVRKSLTSANGKAVVEGAERGFAKLVFDADTDVLLGAQLMCPHASEMIGGLTASVNAGLTAEQLSQTIFPHPTVSEILSL